MSSLIQALVHVRANKLRALGTSGAKRTPILPDVPTIMEAGVPGYETQNWWGVMAPAGTIDAVVRKLNAVSNAVMMLPETRKRLAAEGAESLNVTPEQFAKHILAEMMKWGKVTRDANIKAE